MCAKSIIAQSINSITPIFFMIGLSNEIYQSIVFIGNVLNMLGIGLNFFIYYNFNKTFYLTYNDLADNLRKRFK